MKQLELDLIGYSDKHFFDVMSEYFENKITFNEFLIQIGRSMESKKWLQNTFTGPMINHLLRGLRKVIENMKGLLT